MNHSHNTYRVNEIFYSLQGEGYHTGRAAVFLRLSGCNRACSFCDTRHEPYTLMGIPQIIEAVSAYPARFIVITGGEPLMQLDTPLIQALKQEGFTIAVETNGTILPPPGIDWLTCSPKQKPWAIKECDELKVLFTTPQEVEEAYLTITARHHYLQPLYDAATDTTNAPAVVHYIKAHPHWRLSLQTHRLLNIP